MAANSCPCGAKRERYATGQYGPLTHKPGCKPHDKRRRGTLKGLLYRLRQMGPRLAPSIFDYLERLDKREARADV